jgi:hypothetical protein
MGRAVIGDLYTAMGESIFDVERDGDTEARRKARGTAEHAAEVLTAAGLDVGLAEAVDDESLDAEIASDTEDALARTGRDVGTPIIHFEPPDGVAFFGPVISRVPRGAEAARLWDNVIELARFPGFAELKRSLRETPRLRSFGVDPDEPLVEEDWHQGSRRQDR